MTPTIGDTLFTKKSETTSRLDAEINANLARLKTMKPEDPNYTATTKAVSKLIKMRDSLSTSRSVSPDTLALVLGNLAGVLLIVTYEKHNIVTSKALTFVQKLR
jgi:aspartokinase-like uncharacterized kinase